MVPPHVIGTDARRNLTDAVRVAAETNIHEVVIVFNRKILRGNRTKNSERLNSMHTNLSDCSLLE